MLDSWETPPTTVQESWLTRGIIPLAIAVAVVGVLVSGRSGIWTLNPLLCAAILAGACALGVWRIVHPARLEIGPQELVWVDTIGFKHHYAFADIAEFVVDRGTRYGAQVGFNWTEDSPRRTMLNKVAEALAGVDETIAGTWAMSTQDLVDLLNRARILPSASR